MRDFKDLQLPQFPTEARQRIIWPAHQPEEGKFQVRAPWRIYLEELILMGYLSKPLAEAERFLRAARAEWYNAHQLHDKYREDAIQPVVGYVSAATSIIHKFLRNGSYDIERKRTTWEKCGLRMVFWSGQVSREELLTYSGAYVWCADHEYKAKHRYYRHSDDMVFHKYIREISNPEMISLEKDHPELAKILGRIG